MQYKKCWGANILSLSLAFVLVSTRSLNAAQYEAFSLGAAERILHTHNVEPPAVALTELGEITRPIACIWDERNQDIIIVGAIEPGAAKLRLDDLIVAIRARLKYHQAPLVSIDPPDDAMNPDTQPVRFEGGIANTQFGVDYLDADILLKKIGLGKVSAQIWGIHSYFEMSADHWKTSGKESPIQSRFWFKIDKDKSFIFHRRAVMIIKQSKINVTTEVSGNFETGKQTGAPLQDDIGSDFATSVTLGFDDLAAAYPQLRRLDQLARLEAIAEGIAKFQDADGMKWSGEEYWLNDYPIPQVPTPPTYPRLSAIAYLGQPQASPRMTVSGGVDLRPYLSDIHDGAYSAFRDLVLLTRPPDSDPLTWDVPLDGALDSLEPAPSSESEAHESGGKLTGPGMNLRTEFYHPSSASAGTWTPVPFRSPVNTESFSSADDWRLNLPSPRVGGVYLNGTASVAGGDGQVNIASGNFSLIVDGQNATIAPETFQKFVTALWAVYYCKDPPGISIDPIAHGADKQIVRYIGQVVNTDLGRVMREADYTMKRWAVGTEHPDIPGFEDVDTLTASTGLNLLGASRRFWFVPEDIRFKRGGDMLVFDSGHMRLKTEYRFKEDKTEEAEPADLAFAKFFTDNYDRIATRYPIYRDLFEYTKMVALARYLKESGIPLQWFLLANRDLVLTEDSPGTVDTLAKGSRSIEGMTIEGGVEMGIQGQYVFDQEAMKAIAKAVANEPTDIIQQSKPIDQNANVVRQSGLHAEDVAYSVVPQHSLTSGRDRRGLRYQTDIALRMGIEPGLELVRVFNGKNTTNGEFGEGWHLLVPYRIHAADAQRRTFENADIPVKMSVDNLLNGTTENLTFDENRYSIVGYVPENLATSQLVGVFPLSDATFRLADKLGNELQFDEAGYLTDMFLGSDYHVQYEWLRGATDAVTQPVVRLEPLGLDVVQEGNVVLPAKLTLVDSLGRKGEPLIFSDTEKLLGYFPEKDRRDSSPIRIIAIRNDGEFHLLNKDGHEIAFSPQGMLSRIIIADDNPLPSKVTVGDQSAAFQYALDLTGKVRISMATVTWPRQKNALSLRYTYDDEGNLIDVQRSMPATSP